MAQRLKSFKEYIEKEKQAYNTEYNDALAKISVSSLRDKVTNTAYKDKLSREGLSRSGYAEYLRGESAAEAKDGITLAKRELLEAEANAYSGYAEYLNNYETVQSALNKRFIDSLITDGVFDSEEARRKAILIGIPKERASDIAELGVLISRKRTVSSAVKYAKEKNYSYRGAKYYALSLGLSSADAKRVAEEVSRITEEEAEWYESLDKDAYFDEIKGQQN